MLVHKVRAILSWNGELLDQATSLFHLVDAKKLRGGSLQLGARPCRTGKHRCVDELEVGQVHPQVLQHLHLECHVVPDDRRVLL